MNGDNGGNMEKGVVMSCSVVILFWLSCSDRPVLLWVSYYCFFLLAFLSVMACSNHLVLSVLFPEVLSWCQVWSVDGE
jgi:hypothetical protein